MKKITVTIGIPAYNEEKNIINMLKSVVKQRQESFILEKIIVISDGSTDNSEKKVRAFSKKYPIVKLKADKRRLGKAERLNQLYKLNKSDFLGTFDADIVLERDFEIELMMQIIINRKEVNVVAANQLPAPSKTWMGKFSIASFVMFYEAAKKYRDGNNIHCLQGSCSIIRKNLAKKLKMPAGTSVDQGYLYVMSVLKNRRGFGFVKDTRVIFNPISSFRDWRVLGYRTIVSDKQNLTSIFGRKILREYKIPSKFIYKSMFQYFIVHPFEAVGAIFMNIYIRKFPYHTKRNSNSKGVWEIVTSSKKAIEI